jgi:excisionase family DNA binding protein
MADLTFNREQLTPLVAAIIEQIFESKQFKSMLASAVYNAAWNVVRKGELRNSKAIAADSEFQNDGLARVPEAAKFLGVSRFTIYRMINDKQLPEVLIRDATRIRWSDLRLFQSNGSNQSANKTARKAKK